MAPDIVTTGTRTKGTFCFDYQFQEINYGFFELCLRHLYCHLGKKQNWHSRNCTRSKQGWQTQLWR